MLLEIAIVTTYIYLRNYGPDEKIYAFNIHLFMLIEMLKLSILGRYYFAEKFRTTSIIIDKLINQPP